MSKDDIEASSAPLIEHLIELRRRLVYILIAVTVFFFVCFFFAKPIFNILIIPYENASGSSENLKLIFTAPQEYFFVQMKIAFFGAIFIAFPVIATQVYRFVAPGLYRNEREVFWPFLVATPVLFLAGALLVFYVVMPVALHFFLSMQQAGGDGKVKIELLPKVSEYLGLIMTFIFAFGFVFQLPVAITLLVRVGMVQASTLVEKRKYAILIAFVVAAVLTPPDPLSMITLAVPTMLLYEVSIFAARLIEKQRAEREKQAGLEG